MDTTKDLTLVGQTLCPKTFLAFGRERLRQAGVCNGIGPATGPRWARFPQRILGIDVSLIGDIHDFGYEFSSSYEEKRLHDSIFLFNLFNEINIKSKNAIIRIPRKIIGLIFYVFVFHFGKRAFETKLSSEVREELEREIKNHGNI